MKGGSLQGHLFGDVADEDLAPVGVVARVDEPALRATGQALGHGPACGGVVGAADDQAVAVGSETGVAVPVGAGLLLLRKG